MIGVLLFAAALAGFAFVVIRPRWTAPYFAFLLYLRLADTIRAEYGLPSLFMILAPALLALSVWRWLDSGLRPGRGWAPAVWWMVAYGVVCAASFLYAHDTDVLGEALLNYADGLFIALVISMNLRETDDLRRTAWAVIIAGGVLAGLAVIQQLLGWFDQSFGGFARVELRNIQGASAGFRSEGPMSANYFALVLVAVVPLAVDRALHETRLAARLLGAAAGALALGGIYFTYSRGGVVALVATCIPMLAWVPRRWLALGGATLALPLALLTPQILSSEYGQRLLALREVVGASGSSAPQDRALRGRMSEVTSALMMFRDHPILGVGFGQYESHYHRYAQQIGLDGRREKRQAHSLYLEVAAESGLVGILVFGGLLVYGAVGPWRARDALKARGETDAARLAGAVGLAFVGYLIGSVFLHLSYPRYLWLMVGIAFGTRQWCSVPERRLAPGHARSVLAEPV